MGDFPVETINCVVFGTSMDYYDFGLSVNEECVAILRRAHRVIHPQTCVLQNFMCFTAHALLLAGVRPSDIHRYLLGWEDL